MRVEHDLYCEQDGDTTRLMLHVEGDPPVVLVEYSRSLAERSSKLSIVAVSGPGAIDGSHIGVHITFADPAKAT